MKKSVFLLLGAALLASCSQSEIDHNIDPDAIVLRSSLSKVSASTRAPFVDALSSTNPLTAMVLASATTNNYQTLLAKGTMTFAGGEDGVGFSQLETGDGKFPATPATTPVYLRGFYPAADWTVTTVSQTASYTLNGRDDVMCAAQVATTKAEVLKRDYATLEFEHKLTKLELRFRADAPGTIADWGKVTGIKLVKAATANPNSVLTVDLKGAAAPSFSTPVADLSCYGMSSVNSVNTYTNTVFPASGGYTLTQEATYAAYILPAPVVATTAMKNEYEFQITTVNRTPITVPVELYDKEGNLFVGSTEGYSFTVIFDFVGGFINANATVKEWNEGGESIVIVE